MIHPAFAEAIFHADSIMHSVSKETELFNYIVTGHNLTRL